MNEELGGTIELGPYMWPVNLDRDKVDAILEDQAEQSNAMVEASESRYTEIAPFHSTTTYRFVYEPQGDALDWEKVDRIYVYDRTTDERLGLYYLDDLTS